MMQLDSVYEWYHMVLIFPWLHLVWYYLDLSMLLKMAFHHSFLWWSNITLCVCITVQFSSVAQSWPTLCNPLNYRMPGLPVHHQHLEPIQTHAHWVGDAVQPSHPLKSLSLPALNLSQLQGLFKWWSFSFNISPSNEHSGLISFRMDWLDLLAVQGTLKSLLQLQKLLKSINSSVLSFLDSPTLTLIQDHWKNNSLG